MSSKLVGAATGHLHQRRELSAQIEKSKDIFVNWQDFELAMTTVGDGESVLRTKSGISIAVRHNHWDARIVAEQFIDRDYLKYFTSRKKKPVIVDIGGYIGDFSVYCAGELDARVIVYEPAAENYEMLEKNIALNPALAARITAVKKGVSSKPTVVSNVQTLGREVHVSSFWYSDDPEAEQRTIQCDSLDKILSAHNIDAIDLLKVDCEGGEYDIFSNVSPKTYDRIESIVFEWHRVPGWEKKLEILEADLIAAGFTLEKHGQLEYAYR